MYEMISHIDFLCYDRWDNETCENEMDGGKFIGYNQCFLDAKNEFWPSFSNETISFGNFDDPLFHTIPEIEDAFEMKRIEIIQNMLKF